jgi:hypothetical protein
VHLEKDECWSATVLKASRSNVESPCEYECPATIGTFPLLRLVFDTSALRAVSGRTRAQTNLASGTWFTVPHQLQQQFGSTSYRHRLNERGAALSDSSIAVIDIQARNS